MPSLEESEAQAIERGNAESQAEWELIRRRDSWKRALICAFIAAHRDERLLGPVDDPDFGVAMDHVIELADAAIAIVEAE
jgi:hypothetical protein